MDELKPEKDEVDRFRAQRLGSRKGEVEKAKSISTKKRPEVKRDAARSASAGSFGARASQTDTLIYQGPSGNAKRPPRAGQVNSKSSSWAVSLLFVCLVAVSSYLGFLLWQQSKELTQLKENLAYANDYMKQSKLLMARLEGQLHQNDTELAQSGSALNQRVGQLAIDLTSLSKKLDQTADELRQDIRKQGQSLKVVVSSQKKSIKALEKQMTDRTKQIASVKQQLVSIQGQIADVSQMKKSLAGVQGSTDSLSRQVASLQSSLKEIQANTQNLKSYLATLDGLSQSQDGQDKQLQSLSAALQALQAEVDAGIKAQSGKQDGISRLKEIEAELKSVNQAMTSVDSYRRTANQRTLKLERRLNDIQLQLQAMQGLNK